MAGTRLAIQTVVLLQLLGLVWVSIHYGFCRSTCTRGNLTKDFPLVPGLGLPGSGAAVEPHWWEDALCHPITVLVDALLGDSEEKTEPMSDKGNNNYHAQSEMEDNLRDDNMWSMDLTMSLAVEDLKVLPQWIDLVSEALQVNDDKDALSTFSELLSSNAMGLEILPPLGFENENSTETSTAAIWSHYKSHRSSGATSNEPSPSFSLQENLVIYLPAWHLPEEPIEWKAFGVTHAFGAEKPTTTTMVLPTTPSFGSNAGTPGLLLQPLIEDWMVRTIRSQRQRQMDEHEHAGRKPSARPPTRLTREFPIEHFLAVLMPLLFPLIMPFLVSWVKEYKRFKQLRKERATNKEAEVKALETPSPTATPTTE